MTYSVMMQTLKKNTWVTELFFFFLTFFYSVTSVAANDGVWHHICVSWEKDSGSWKFYKDGDLEEEGTNFKKGHTITQGGTLVLGQEQDSVGGGFQSVQSFQGMLSNVNVWNRVVSGRQVQDLSKSCESDDRYEGNVYKWVDFLREGGPSLTQSLTCKAIEAGTRSFVILSMIFMYSTGKFIINVFVGRFHKSGVLGKIPSERYVWPLCFFFK